jgi:hypothetical protein
MTVKVSNSFGPVIFSNWEVAAISVSLRVWPRSEDVKWRETALVYNKGSAGQLGADPTSVKSGVTESLKSCLPSTFY